MYKYFSFKLLYKRPCAQKWEFKAVTWLVSSLLTCAQKHNEHWCAIYQEARRVHVTHMYSQYTEAPQHGHNALPGKPPPGTMKQY